MSEMALPPGAYLGVLAPGLFESEEKLIKKK